MRYFGTLLLVALVCLIGGMEMQSRLSRPAIAWNKIKTLVQGPALPAFRAPSADAVPCPPKAIGILVIGQSHGANYVGERFATKGHTFVAVDGKCYPAIDPLPGTDGKGGNLWTDTGNHLAHRAGQKVTLLIASIGATKISQWAPGGDLHRHLMKTIEQRPSRISAVAIQIGESDHGDGTSRADFARDLGATIQSLRRAGLVAPVFVARESGFFGREHPSAAITAAQNDVLNPARRIFAGPNFDGVNGRYDGCHFSGAAARSVASLWVDKLVPELVSDKAGATNP